MPKTQPEKQVTPKGHEIPIPKKEDFVENMRKVIDAEPPPPRMRKPRKARSR